MAVSPLGPGGADAVVGKAPLSTARAACGEQPGEAKRNLREERAASVHGVAPAQRYFPWYRGGRPSASARRPSTKSSVRYSAPYSASSFDIASASIGSTTRCAERS